MEINDSIYASQEELFVSHVNMYFHFLVSTYGFNPGVYTKRKMDQSIVFKGKHISVIVFHERFSQLDLLFDFPNCDRSADYRKVFGVLGVTGLDEPQYEFAVRNEQINDALQRLSNRLETHGKRLMLEQPKTIQMIQTAIGDDCSWNNIKLY